MSPPFHPVLQELNNLDRSSSKFHDRLSNVLHGEEYMRCLGDLQGDDLVWLVDYLDETLCVLAQFSAAFRKGLRELKKICGSRRILPRSYTLPYNLTIQSEAFTSGGFGDIYRGTLDRSEVCVKRVRVYATDGQKEASRPFREAVMWKHLKHPNIVPLLGVTTAPFQLISDWMPGGDLFVNVQKPNADRLGLLSDIAAGLCYLHSCNVIHGDLKGQNILVDNSGHARITDFGLALVTQNLDSVQSSSSRNGNTPRYSAPEVLEDGMYSKEADIFSFAMVMIDVFTGAVPFVGKPATSAMLSIMGGTRPPKPKHPTFTTELWTLMQNCWKQDPCSRPTISEVLNVLRGADYPTWKSLINDPLPVHERISLITTIFLNSNQVKLIRNLSGDDAQSFVDKIDEVLDGLAPQMHKKCLRYLYLICGRRAILPRSLEVQPRFDMTEDPVCHRGLTDVWKGQYQGGDVAAQVLRISPEDDTKKVRRRFCREAATWWTLRHPNVLPLLGVTTTENHLVMVSEWMSKGNIVEFTRAGTDVDRLGLLRGVARGLIYMHDKGIIHGDLKGVNILVDNGGCARLTGFNLVTMTSDRTTIESPQTAEGTIPWMSPELLHPEKFGLKDSFPTLASDRYALGMVMYEVLSGKAPFFKYRDHEVVFLVLEGRRPERPQGGEGELFTDQIWETLNLCWEQQPGDRISAGRVLKVLEGNSYLSRLPSYADEDTDIDDQPPVAESDSGPSVASSNVNPTAPQRPGDRKGKGVGGMMRGIKRFFGRDA